MQLACNIPFESSQQGLQLALQTCPPQGLTFLQHFKNVLKVMSSLSVDTIIGMML
jgi:hypothetical protein